MQKGYFGNSTIGSLPWEEWALSGVSTDCATEIQDQWLKATISHPLSLKYPPVSSYRKAFLKTFIRRIEEQGWELHELVLEKYLELLKIEDEFGYRTLFLPNNLSVSLRETASLISCGTTGLRTWQASYLLADFCLESSHLLEGKKVLELGSGTGFAGLACVLGCEPCSYNFTDCHGKVLELLKHNVFTNLDLSIPDQVGNLVSQWKSTVVTVSELNWEDCQDKDLDCDLVLAADVVYDESLIPALVSVIIRAVSKGASAYVACTVRNEQTLATFLQALSSANISCELKAPKDRWFSASYDSPMHIYHLGNKMNADS